MDAVYLVVGDYFSITYNQERAQRHVGPGAGCEDGTKLERCRGDAHRVGQRLNIKDLELKPEPSHRGRLKGDAGAPPTDPQRAAVAEQQAIAI